MTGIAMPDEWHTFVRHYRLRHGLTQSQLAALLSVSQRTISRWEREEDTPNIAIQKRLRDLGWSPPVALLQSMRAAVIACPVPRALSRTPRLELQALSRPALAKRPSMAGWIGRELAGIASGVLKQMLDDRDLQRAIARRDIANVIATTGSVLRTPESKAIGVWRTTITYFYQDGTFFSDAVSVAAPANSVQGYRAVPMDDIPTR